MDDTLWAYHDQMRDVSDGARQDASEGTEDSRKRGWFGWFLTESSETSRQNDTRAETEALALAEWARVHSLATECTKARSEFKKFGLNEPRKKATLEERGKEFAKAYRAIQDRCIVGRPSLDTESIATTSGKRGECVEAILETADLISGHTNAITMPTQTDIWDLALKHNYRSVAEDIWQRSTRLSQRKYYTKQLTGKCVTISTSFARKYNKFSRYSKDSKYSKENYEDLEQWALFFDRASEALKSETEDQDWVEQIEVRCQYIHPKPQLERIPQTSHKLGQFGKDLVGDAIYNRGVSTRRSARDRRHRRDGVSQQVPQLSSHSQHLQAWTRFPFGGVEPTS